MMSAIVITWDERERLVASRIAARHTRIHEVHTTQERNPTRVTTK
jgi:hypothetical protein